jgi:SprA family protein
MRRMQGCTNSRNTVLEPVAVDSITRRGATVYAGYVENFVEILQNKRDERDTVSISSEARAVLTEVSGDPQEDSSGRGQGIEPRPVFGAEGPSSQGTATDASRLPGDEPDAETATVFAEDEAEEAAETAPEAPARTGAAADELTEEEQQQVQEMATRDREVRAHEQAHVAAGGSNVRGGASFEYDVGPDGQQYAVGGHVQIDVSSERDPRATIAKMRQVKSAALAPANPSGADRAVASHASATEASARAALAEEAQAAAESLASDDSSTGPIVETVTPSPRDGADIPPASQGMFSEMEPPEASGGSEVSRLDQ